MCSVVVALMTFNRRTPTMKGVILWQPKHPLLKWLRFCVNNSVRRQEERLASTRRVQANVNALNRIDRPPPPYVTPPSSSIVRSEVVVHQNAPRISRMRNCEAESKRTSYKPDPTGRSYGRVVYSRVPAVERFNFTPVNANSPPPNPSDSLNDSS